MKFDIYGRFQLDIQREGSVWTAYRSDAGKRVRAARTLPFLPRYPRTGWPSTWMTSITSCPVRATGFRASASVVAGLFFFTVAERPTALVRLGRGLLTVHDGLLRFDGRILPGSVGSNCKGSQRLRQQPHPRF